MRPLESFSLYNPFYVWFFLVCSSFAVFIDQGLSFAVIPEIREDPKIASINKITTSSSSIINNSVTTTTNTSSSDPVLTTAQAGLFSTLFLAGFLIGTPLASIVAPKIGTNLLLKMGFVLSVAALIGTAFAPNFYLLLFFRFLVGFSEAGYMPFAVNIIDLICTAQPEEYVNYNQLQDEEQEETGNDRTSSKKNPSPVAGTMYSSRMSSHKTLLLSFYFAALPIGAAVGLIGGGAAAEHLYLTNSETGKVTFAGWRCAFLFVDCSLMFFLMIFGMFIPTEYELTKLERRHALIKKIRRENQRKKKNERRKQRQLLRERSSTNETDENGDDSQEQNNDFKVITTTAADDCTSNRVDDGDVTGVTDSVFAIPFFTALGRLVFGNLNYILVVLGYALFDFLVNVFSSFATVMLVQGPYGLENSTTAASSILGASSACAGLCGTVLGGYVVDHKLKPALGIVEHNDDDDEDDEDDDDNEEEEQEKSPTELANLHKRQEAQARLKNYKLIVRVLLIGVACCIIAVPLAIFAAMSTTVFQFLIFFIPAMIVINFPAPGMTVALLEVVPSELKPYAISIALELACLFGDLAAPLVTGLLSGEFGGICGDLLTKDGCQEYSSTPNNNNNNSTSSSSRNMLSWWRDTNCEWHEAAASSDALSYCASTSQVNKGIMTAASFSILQVPLWGIVCWRLWKETTRTKSSDGEDDEQARLLLEE